MRTGQFFYSGLGEMNSGVFFFFGILTSRLRGFGDFNLIYAGRMAGGRRFTPLDVFNRI